MPVLVCDGRRERVWWKNMCCWSTAHRLNVGVYMHKLYAVSLEEKFYSSLEHHEKYGFYCLLVVCTSYINAWKSQGSGQ